MLRTFMLMCKQEEKNVLPPYGTKTLLTNNSPLPLVTCILVSLSMNLMTPASSYKQNRMVFVFLWHNVEEMNFSLD